MSNEDAVPADDQAAAPEEPAPAPAPKVAPQYPGISATVNRLLPQIPFEVSETASDVDLRVPPEHLRALVEGLKSKPDLQFDFLRNVVGLDFVEEGLAIKYQFYSFRHGHAVQLTVPCAPGDPHPHLPTLTDIYPTADWHEREAAEMFGFVFDGHPDPRNLLLEEDLRIHPLLKAHPLQKPEILQGIEDGGPGFGF